MTRIAKTKAISPSPPNAITPDAINFMATHGRGLICLALAPEMLRRAAFAFDLR